MHNITMMKHVKKDLENNLIPVICSQPGKGLISDLHELADKMQTKAFELRCSMLFDLAEIKTAAATAIDYANQHPKENPLLIIDDINRTIPDMSNKLINICLTHMIQDQEKQHNIPDNLHIIITCVYDGDTPIATDTIFHCHFNHG